MEVLSPPIKPTLVLRPRTSHSDHTLLSLRSLKNPKSNLTRILRNVEAKAHIEKHVSTAATVDYGDPGWKESTRRSSRRASAFRISPMRLENYFCYSFSGLRFSLYSFYAKYGACELALLLTPLSPDFADGYPTDEEWHGYINNNDRVLLKVIHYSSPKSAGAQCIDPACTWVEQWVHRAGPREKIYFKPEEVKAAIVTCGGLCPGLNDVIRQIVITLEIYGVKQIVGIPFGYRGFSDSSLTEMPLSRTVVQNIHLSGGSLLGVSRGGPTVTEIVDSMEERGINMLFVLGGNGTHAGANAIHEECRKRRLRIAVVGVPKTIDNDILHMDKTFGFDTAVEEAQRAIYSAYIEAHSAYRGIGIVKLMGRSSGFIAMQASLASGQIDICLIPEVPFNLHGPQGVLSHLKYLLETKGSAVVCVAEGAGQDLLQKTNATDASGNIILGDIGAHIQQETKKFFKETGFPADVKYIDPTYMIRAGRANASDGILCTVLGQNASLQQGYPGNVHSIYPMFWQVHGAFAGYSGITVGICNTHYVYFPIPEVITEPKVVDPNSRMWHRCLTSTGQPDFI
ncbi:ATP-dependent 6-phosphofructokinase, chloroplastic [Sesamum angolense]|uniref:ATP-dependent 6-phosphofructokinase n=1 Tax=Sesamum angolense TaxID=2727404 RepID=A0AAE1XH84_9LAMI|nr:ATP-dependent 6-phosphofructokinase, chloroplastic [Sesamum angolense]